MLELNVKGEWQGALSQADTCVHWCGHRTRESLCHGKRSVTSSVWTVPVAVKGGAPGLGDDSKASWLHLKTMEWVGKWTPFTFWTDRSCENLPCRSIEMSSERATPWPPVPLRMKTSLLSTSPVLYRRFHPSADAHLFPSVPQRSCFICKPHDPATPPLVYTKQKCTHISLRRWVQEYS